MVWSCSALVLHFSTQLMTCEKIAAICFAVNFVWLSGLADGWGLWNELFELFRCTCCWRWSFDVGVGRLWVNPTDDDCAMSGVSVDDDEGCVQWLRLGNGASTKDCCCFFLFCVKFRLWATGESGSMFALAVNAAEQVSVDRSHLICSFHGYQLAVEC